MQYDLKNSHRVSRFISFSYNDSSPSECQSPLFRPLDFVIFISRPYLIKPGISLLLNKSFSESLHEDILASARIIEIF